jgi:Fe-S-cluster containining protein
MQEKEIRPSDGVKIRGKCLRCGKCCVYTNWIEAKQEKKEEGIDFYSAFFGEAKIVCVDSEWALLRTNYRCKHLDVNNKCLIHKQKPAWCKGFPRNFTPNLFKKIRPKDCGYKVTVR